MKTEEVIIELFLFLRLGDLVAENTCLNSLLGVLFSLGTVAVVKEDLSHLGIQLCVPFKILSELLCPDYRKLDVQCLQSQ